ncbi:MAG TPA: radical SAM protein [Candidatus Paceibacterota bacterium]|nr:radical SAM protein [Candidatus Paceibacterota bacterium]
MFRVILANVAADGLVSKVEHLGLGYLAATLARRGFAGRIVDASFHRLRLRETLEHLTSEASCLVGFTVYYNNIRPTLSAIRKLRLEGYRGHITLGGHHATFHAEDLLARHPEIDSVVRGEGEGALCDLAAAVATGSEWRGIANVACRRAGAIILNPCRPLIVDLDELPFPVRDPYVEFLREHGIATVISTRGCYGRCSFCSIRAFYRLARGRIWRPRSCSSVVDEIEGLARAHGVRRINFVDDEFIGPGAQGRAHALGIGEELRRRGLGLQFNIVCRPDSVDESVLGALQRAGLFHVSLGIESWVPRQLALYGKGVTREQNLRAVEVVRRLGLDYLYFLIPADPHLTIEELNENLDQIERAGIEHAAEGFTFSQVMAFRGAPIKAQFDAAGLTCRHSREPEYLGPAAFEFQDVRVREVYRRWRDLFGEFIALRVSVGRSPRTWLRGGPEELLNRRWQQALAVSGFRLFRELVRACQPAPGAAALDDFDRMLEDDLDRLVYGRALVLEAAVESDHGEGSFLPLDAREAIRPVWSGVVEGYQALADRAEALLRPRLEGRGDRLFARRVRCALRDSALHLCDRVVPLCKARRFERARAVVRRELSALRAGVARIEQAAVRGDFANCVFFTIRMGRMRLVYPGPGVRRLVRRYLRTLAGAAKGPHASPATGERVRPGARPKRAGRGTE